MRRCPKPTTTLRERLLKFAEEIHRAVRLLPPGKEREALLRKARRIKEAKNIEKWLSSPGLRPPI
jgi:hypothetical protein